MVEKIIDHRWRTVEILGEGGNAVVYKVSDITKNDGIFYALKVITKEQPDKKRLRIEIDTQKEFTDAGVIGVLPLLEYSFPENPTEEAPIWLLMPIAETMRRKIEKGNLNLAVVALLSISRTLLKCASYKDGFLHRDIKPENIFFYNGGWCIGDFGLVDFIIKDNISKHGDRIGSNGYIAPECFSGHHDFTIKSEVYSLAKTLFSQVTGDRPPIPGPHSILDVRTCLQPEKDNFVMSVNQLLAQSTQNDKEKRINLASFIDGLEKCLQVRGMKNILASDDKIDSSLSILYKEKLAIIDTKKKTIQEKENYVKELNDKIWYELERLYALELRKYSNECMKKDVIFMTRFQPYSQNIILSSQYPGTHICISNNSDNSNSFNQFHFGESFHAGIQVIFLPEDKVQIIAGIMHAYDGKIDWKWSFGEAEVADLYSSDEKMMIKKATDGLKENFGKYFPEFIQNMQAS